jgi:hypothetical protein
LRNNFGALRRTQGDSKEAELSFRESLALSSQMPKESLYIIGPTRSTLASTLADQGVDLHTDSQYVRDGITLWIERWKRNGWRTSDKKPVKNVDLWQRLDAALKPHELRWHWIKGHAGHDENERADQLARDGVALARLKA